jgi:hypothetical protein
MLRITHCNFVSNGGVNADVTKRLPAGAGMPVREAFLKM